MLGDNQFKNNKTPYQKERDKLIPLAVKEADNLCGPAPPLFEREEWNARWNRIYHNAMNRLWAERGGTRR